MQIKSIISFLETQGWVKSGESNLFVTYTPPKTLAHLPDGYFIEIAKDEDDKGYKRYITELMGVLHEVYENQFSNKDIAEFFKPGSTRKKLTFEELEQEAKAMGFILVKPIKQGEIEDAIKNVLLDTLVKHGTD